MMRKKQTGFSLLAIIAGVCRIDPAVAQRQPDPNVGHRQYTKLGTMDGNLVRTIFLNHGEVANWNLPNLPSGEWPKGSGQTYIDGVPVIVSVETRDIYGNIIHPMETMYREFIDLDPETLTPWGWAPLPGYANPDQDEPALSDDPNTWPATWPDRPPEWDGFWNGFFGKGVFNAQLETYFVFDDDPDEEWDFYPDSTDLERRGVGLEVATRGFQWSNVLAEDTIFWLYQITNEGTTDYTRTVFAQYIDWGVGGHDDSGDDSGSYDTKLDIAFAWDSDNRGTPGNWSPVGVAGYGFLESPGNGSNGKDDDEDGLIDERRDDGIDNDNDWRPFSDLNGNGEWDEGEPLNDDLGADGIGPFDEGYTGPDFGQGDGRPTPGEPNFDATDPDESDQIGLTGFSIFPVHFYELTDDEQNWEVFTSALPPREELLQSVNLGMFFSSGTFPLLAGQTESFSMALLFGEDLDDLARTKKTVQQIYDADYRFAEPPKKPTLYAVPGDRKVTLYWDDVAESSYDRFLQQYDFEGYAIYRATDPELLEPRIITDSYGNLTFRKPIARFDLKNGLKGPHPIDVRGIKYDLGNDTGLRHVYVDTEVENGQTYYYAVVAYDRGFIDTTVIGTVEGIPPSETTAIIKTDLVGGVKTDINTAVVTPRAPVAGYVPADIPGGILKEAVTTGTIQVDIVDPRILKDNHTYEVDFMSRSPYFIDERPLFRIRNLTTGETIVEDMELAEQGQMSPVFDGLMVLFYNAPGVSVIDTATGWLVGESDLQVEIRLSPLFFGRNVPYPADYEIQFFDTVVDTSVRLLFGQKRIPTRFRIWNVTESRREAFMFFDYDDNAILSPGDELVIAIGDSAGKPPRRGTFKTAWSFKFFSDSAVTEPRLPRAGDVFQMKTTKPFRSGDRFRFTIRAPSMDVEKARQDLEKIAVVPNPYVVAASWEPRSPFTVGRGPRKLAFINLPPKCTIRIYTTAGYLVDTIEHESSLDNGTAFWDMVSRDGMDIAYGVYIYHVDAPGIGQKIGKFAVVK